MPRRNTLWLALSALLATLLSMLAQASDVSAAELVLHAGIVSALRLALDDHNPCTHDHANTQGEHHDPPPAGAPCNDDDACNGQESCDAAGNCLAGIALAVSDGDPATLDLCDYEYGVRHTKPSVIDRVLPTSIADSNKFLYEGDDALQVGVAANTIVRDHAAVLHGKVLTRDGGALETVRITVHDHAEFGRTATRPDGEFELVVNGGGPLTVRYEKPGYLPVQRRVQTGWREHGYADDVVMIPVDEDFAAETAATATLENGTTEPPDTLHARATEYTVGPTGRPEMRSS